MQRWIGPFEVIERINPKVYRLRMGDNYKGSPVFNFDHLKKYHSSPQDLGSRTTMPELERRKAPSEEFPIEKIVGHRYQGKNKKIQYLVRWEGYGPQFDSWRSLVDLKNASIFLRKYREANGL